MSLAYPFVVAFSQNQLTAPVEERINAVESALLYLRREGVPTFEPASASKPLADTLQPFLSRHFYQSVDPKRAALNGGEVQIPLGYNGLQQLGYILHGDIVTVELTGEQKDIVRDLGFDVRSPALKPPGA